MKEHRNSAALGHPETIAVLSGYVAGTRRVDS